MSAQVHVYIAGRSEDLAQGQQLRERLTKHGIACTSTWLGGLIPDKKRAALICLQDIARADVVLLMNPTSVHKSGTGGRHTEVGIAIGRGQGVVLVGEAENVFHELDLVRCVPGAPKGSIADIVTAVRELAARGTPGALHGSDQQRAEQKC